MGYADYPLGLDSAPLAQIMLEDLVATTEALRDSEESTGGVRHRLEIAEQLLEPLQEENLKLRRDNTQLHQQMITIGEESLKIQNKHASSSFALQTENRRISLAKQQAEEELDKVKKELKQTKLQLAQALDPLGSSKVSSRAPSNARSRKTSRDSRSNFSENSWKSGLNSSLSVGETVAQSEYDALQVENNQQKQHINELTNKIEELNGCIKLRDEEIQRLGEELQKETGRDGYLMSLRYKYQKAEEEIEKLRTQVRLINPRPVGKSSTPRKASIQQKSGKPSKQASSAAQQTSQQAKLALSDSFIQESFSPDFKLAVSSLTPSDQSNENKQEKNNSKSPKSEKSNQNQNQIKELNQKIKELEQNNEQLKVLLEKKEEAIAEMAANFAFIGDNITPSMFKNQNKALNVLEKRMKEMQSQYEAEIEELNNKLNSQQPLLQPDDPVAKMMANTANMDSFYKGSPNEIQQLKQQLADAQAKLNSVPDTSAIVKQLKQEHKAMQNEIQQKAAEIERLKKLIKG